MTFKKLLFILIVLPFISSCATTTFYGKAPKTFAKDVEPITIFWNSYATEDEIKQALEKRIVEILSNSDYKDYQILFQTNNNLGFARRTYYLKLFLTNEEKEKFNSKQTANEQLIELTKSPNFKERWDNAGFITIKMTFELFPEFYSYNFTIKLIPDGDMVYVCPFLELTFDTKGFLISKSLTNASL